MALQLSEPEGAMEAPLLTWLRQRRWIREETLVVRELPWHGRRVDVATLTKTGISTAYELKLRHTRRVLEQSSLNALSFDRSCIVTASRPSPDNLAQAEALGLGILLMGISTGTVELLLAPARQKVAPTVRLRLRRKIAAGSGVGDVW